MTRCPTPGHLCSWARFAPGVAESAGKKTGTSGTGHCNTYLARVLDEAAVTASHTNTFLGERYRRIAGRSGANKAIVAVGRSILVVIWHLLSEPDTTFHDLGADFYTSNRVTLETGQLGCHRTRGRSGNPGVGAPPGWRQRLRPRPPPRRRH
jgi:transposase